MSEATEYTPRAFDLQSLDSDASNTSTPARSSSPAALSPVDNLIASLAQLSTAFQAARVANPKDEDLERKEGLLTHFRENMSLHYDAAEQPQTVASGELGQTSEKCNCRDLGELMHAQNLRHDDNLRVRKHPPTIQRLNSHSLFPMYQQFNTTLQEALREKDATLRIMQHDHEETIRPGLNVGADFALAIGGFGFDTKPTLSTTLDLDNLDKHGVIEHDASLSRQDFHLGNNALFNQTLFDVVLGQLPAGATNFDFASAAAGRWQRVVDSKAKDPSFVYTPKELVLSYGETALYLSVLGSPISGGAPVSYVKTFFESERLPYDEGWRPTTVETNLATLGLMVAQLQMASPSAALAEEDFTITESTLKAAFSGDEVDGLIPCPLGGTGCVGN
ncbi:hypothetical protein P7C70_g5137, partial [Phenoliferia sp. Uapishka_3]